MAGSSTPELAIEVCNAGGLGSVACAMMTADELRSVAEQMRAGTNSTFNLNFFAHAAPKSDAEALRLVRAQLQPWYDRFDLGDPPGELPVMGPGFDADRLALLLELKPPVVSFHFGFPDREAINALKDAGILLLSSATNVAEARNLQGAGIDAIIAQGWEAGGHRGSHVATAPLDGVGTFALVPQVADAVDVPVIAAGGVGDGRGIAAAFALGACGVQIGTGYLSCPEAATDDTRREMLREATDTDTLVSDSVSGRSARTARSRYSAEMEQTRDVRVPFPGQYMLVKPILDAADDEEASFHLYGQAAALNLELGARELTEKLASDALAVMARMGPAG